MKNWMYLLSFVIVALTTVQPIEAQIFRKKKSNAKDKAKNSKYSLERKSEQI